MNFRSLLVPSRPHVAVGIGADRVSAVAVSTAADRVVVTAHASEPLSAGAVAPALTAANIAARPAVVGALRRVFERLGQKPRRVALAVPDTIARVSLLRFEKMPTRADDLDQMIRFQLRKSAPFNIDEGQITYSQGATLDGGGRELVVAVARRDVIREYESVCEEAGAHAGLVDLATLGVIRAVADGAPKNEDCLLVHVAPQYTALAILRGADLIFYRSRPEEADGDLSSLVHQTAMYYEDRLGGQRFAKVLLVAGGADAGETLRRAIEQRLGTPVQTITTKTIHFGDRISLDAAMLDRYLPLIGLLQR